MRMHNLKTDPIPFQETVKGFKNNEVRYDDRGYHVGDYLCLKQTVSSGEDMASGLIDHPLEYTGAHILCRITHIHFYQGMKINWKVLSHTVVDMLLPSIEDARNAE